jgi:hemin uptake protein HemP
MSADTTAANPDPGEDASRDQESKPIIVASQTLLRGRREIWIEHGESMYCLRLTLSGKLYLTK